MSVDLIIEGPVAKIVLNRPEKLNALTYEMRAQLREYAQQLRFDENVRAIIITGEGRAFCTGADVGRMQRGGLARRTREDAGRQPQFPAHAACDRKADHRRGARSDGRHRLEHRPGLRPDRCIGNRPLLAGVPAHRPGAGRRGDLVPDASHRPGARQGAGVHRALRRSAGGVVTGAGELRRAGWRADGEEPRSWQRIWRPARPSRSAWRRSCSTWRAGRVTRIFWTTKRSCSRNWIRPRTIAKVSPHSGRSGSRISWDGSAANGWGTRSRIRSHRCQDCVVSSRLSRMRRTSQASHLGTYIGRRRRPSGRSRAPPVWRRCDHST